MMIFPSSLHVSSIVSSFSTWSFGWVFFSRNNLPVLSLNRRLTPLISATHLSPLFITASCFFLFRSLHASLVHHSFPFHSLRRLVGVMTRLYDCSCERASLTVCMWNQYTADSVTCSRRRSSQHHSILITERIPLLRLTFTASHCNPLHTRNPCSSYFSLSSLTRSLSVSFYSFSGSFCVTCESIRNRSTHPFLVPWLTSSNQVVGGSCVGLGTWSFLEENSQLSMIRVQNVKDIIFNISLALVFLGVIVFSMSFAGCLGALRENLCLLKLYSLMLLILFIGEILLSTVAFVFPNALSHYLKDTLAKDPLMKYRDDANLQNLIDVIQRELKCCGISDGGYKDWSQNIYFNCSISNPSPEKCAVPYSCCRNPRNFDVSHIQTLLSLSSSFGKRTTRLSADMFVGRVREGERHVWRERGSSCMTA